MLDRIPLRTRVTLLYTLMGLILSVLFTGAVLFVAEDYEDVILGQVLGSQAQDFADRVQHTPEIELPRGENLSVYLRRADGSGTVPEAFASLPPGIHESGVADEEGLHIGVFDTVAGRFYLAIDLMDIEVLEGHLRVFLLAIVVLGTLVSAWLGALLSGRVIQPVRHLAEAVEQLPVRPLQTALGENRPLDELARLGSAIDDYQRRLLVAEASEHRFFADASHELRTPISVVKGATELLLEDSVDVPALRPRLLRLERGVNEMSELLDALLRLARHRSDPPESVALRSWLETCLHRVSTIRTGSVLLRVEGDDDCCPLSLHEAELVIGGITRQLLPPAATGELHVSVSTTQIHFHFIEELSEQPAPPSLQTVRSDHGRGLTLLGRLAEQLAWHIDDSDLESGTVSIALGATD